MQLSPDPDRKGGCLIVEVPHPDFVTDPALKAEVAAVRRFLRDSFYGGRLPSAKAAIVPREVTVVGALFYDMPHYNRKIATDPGGGRGVHCTVRTLWELHPVTAIR